MSLPSRRVRAALLALLCLLASAPALPSCARHARSASLLLRFSQPGEPSGVAALGSHPVDEEAGTLSTALGPRRMKLYRPRGVDSPPSLVLLHGIHRLGVDEPRLARFARAIAASGVTVMTPELLELTDYRIDARSLGTIGEASRELARRTGRAKVGVLGMSFAGGLALLAACDKAESGAIGFVVSIGGHHDLPRVARFLLRHQIETPDGQVVAARAHDYGLLVLLYGRTEEVFGHDDAPAAHEALRLWLAEEREAARAKAKELSEAGQAKMQLVFEEKHAPLAAELMTAIARAEPEMRAVSPSGHLASLGADVFLLHGAGDTVIPPTETLWLARETPAPRLVNALVTPAVQHVELEGKPSLAEQAALVHFMAQLLEHAQNEPLSAR